VHLSNYAKDMFVAPEMSRFTTAWIRDMASLTTEQEHWLTNFILNTLMRARVEERVRRTLFNFLRRAQLAFREYSLARTQTMIYLSNSDALGTYVAAIGHWEMFLFQAYEAYEPLARPAVTATTKHLLFGPRDGTPHQRLHSLYNRSKHHASAIQNDQLPEDGTIAVWLVNDGLRSTDSWLTFDEMAEILDELARWSDAVQDPLGAREKILSHIAGGETAPQPG
jgi:hypothetical protein